MYLQCRLSQNLVCLSFRLGLSPIVVWCVATWAVESFSFLTILSAVQLSNPTLNTSGLHTGTCTQNLTNLMGRAYRSGYSTMMDWERKVSRRRDCIEYIIIQKKDIPALLPIPTYWETEMLTAVTLLSAPFLSVCIQQQLLWTTLKKRIRRLIHISAHKPGTSISKTMVLKASPTWFRST